MIEEPIIDVRSTSDIAMATCKILQSLSPSCSCSHEVASLARLAFYHLAQNDLWLKYTKKYPQMTSVVISTFGDACSPEVIVTFIDGSTKKKCGYGDYYDMMNLEGLMLDMIYDYELEHHKQ